MKMLKKKSSRLNRVVSAALTLAILIAALVIDLPDGSSEVKAANDPYFFVGGHVENDGWANLHQRRLCFPDGYTEVGTERQSKRLEALKLGISSSPYSGKIWISVRFFDGTTDTEHLDIIKNYAHYQYTGVAGTVGQSKPIEAVKIWFEGEINQHYRIIYEVHSQNIGWPDQDNHYVTNYDVYTLQGGWAGTRGQNLRVEKIAVKLFPR